MYIYKHTHTKEKEREFICKKIESKKYSHITPSDRQRERERSVFYAKVNNKKTREIKIFSRYVSTLLPALIIWVNFPEKTILKS